MSLRTVAVTDRDDPPDGAPDGAPEAGAPTWLDHRPGPGGAPVRRTVTVHAWMETRLLLRNPEQLLVAVVIPLLALVVLDRTSLLDSSLRPGLTRVDLALPGVLALAALSTAFTSTAITTGFDRRYGVLRRLGATPLSRAALVGGKVLSVLAVLVGQVVVLTAAAVPLGWRSTGVGAPGVLGALLLLVLGVAALVPVALLVGGTLRAEATLAVANVVYVLLLGLSAVLVPADRYPPPVAAVATGLPSGALAEGLRSAATGSGVPAGSLLALLLWATVGTLACARWFRWD